MSEPLQIPKKFYAPTVTEIGLGRLKEGDRFLMDDDKGNVHEVKIVSLLKGFPRTGWTSFRLISNTYQEGEFFKWAKNTERVLKLKKDWYLRFDTVYKTLGFIKKEEDDY